jgi:hypothetical protein
MNQMDPHYMAVIAGLDSALQIALVLPSVDLIEEQRDVLKQSIRILLDVLDGKHYGTNSLNSFLQLTSESRREIENIKESL